VRSRLVLEGERAEFAAVLAFYETPEDVRAAEERLAPLRAEVDRAMATFGEFQPLHEVRGTVLGAIRVDRAEVGAPTVLGVGRQDSPPPVPGQQTQFIAVMRGEDGVVAFVHVAHIWPRDRWPEGIFFRRGFVVHVDGADVMP
jgi:hypothetical protein